MLKLGDGGATVNPPASRTTTQFSGIVRNNQQIHSVTVGAAGPVDLELNWTDSRASVGVRARAPSGVVVFENIGSGRPKSGSFFAAAAGLYQFEVVGLNDRRTSYTLSVTHPVAQQTPASLSLLTLDPTSVSGGSSSTGMVALNAAAPPGGAAVALASSNTTAASVPASVTVPAGQTSATFTITTANVTVDSSSSISASHGGVTRSAILSVQTSATSTPEPAEDTVSITRAEYDSDKRVLRVEASSSGSGATLRAHVTSTDQLIGTLSGGRGEFSWASNPVNITVRSSLGGSASRSVTVK